jgi:uncharacterized cupredoxin-like copper-binding protein
MPLRFPSSGGRLAAVAAAGCVAAAVAAPAPTAAEHTAAVTRVTVKMTEYRFRLSTNRVRAGTVVFTVINKGELAHIFLVNRLHKQTPLLQPGKRSTLRVTFRKAARYYYTCPVGAHVQYGMWGYLRVVK